MQRDDPNLGTEAEGKNRRSTSGRELKARVVGYQVVMDQYAIYRIDVSCQGAHWTVWRRFSEFHLLAQNLDFRFSCPSCISLVLNLINHLGTIWMTKSLSLCLTHDPLRTIGQLNHYFVVQISLQVYDVCSSSFGSVTKYGLEEIRKYVELAVRLPGRSLFAGAMHNVRRVSAEFPSSGQSSRECLPRDHGG